MMWTKFRCFIEEYRNHLSLYLILVALILLFLLPYYPSEHKNLTGLVISHGLKSTDTGNETYAMVKLNDGKSVRVPISSRGGAPVNATICIMEKTSVIGFKSYSYIKKGKCT